MPKENVATIILAAGKGERMGGGYKQFMKINGKRIIFYSLEKFLPISFISNIIVVLPPPKIIDFSRILSHKINDPRVQYIQGGRTRRESSFFALKFLKKHHPKTDFVIFQDAARPLISRKMIKDVFAAAKKHGAATTGIGAVDTVGKIKKTFMIGYFDRREILQVHLPQCYRFKWILNAHLSPINKSVALSDTENSILLLRCGKKIKVIPNFYPNTKLTYKQDLNVVSTLLRKKVEGNLSARQNK